MTTMWQILRIARWRFGLWHQERLFGAWRTERLSRMHRDHQA
jgi:hypothetical protein